MNIQISTKFSIGQMVYHKQHGLGRIEAIRYKGAVIGLNIFNDEPEYLVRYASYEQTGVYLESTFEVKE